VRFGERHQTRLRAEINASTNLKGARSMPHPSTTARPRAQENRRDVPNNIVSFFTGTPLPTIADLEGEIRHHVHCLGRIYDPTERAKHERAVDNLQREIDRRSNVDWVELDRRRRGIERNGALAEQQPSPPPPPLPYVNMSTWDSKPVPEQEWTVLNRIPRRQCVLFSGEGAAGKSTTQLHLSCAHVLGRDWLGTMAEKGPAVFIDAEDDEGVMHRRLAAIIKHYGVTFAEPNPFRSYDQNRRTNHGTEKQEKDTARDD
jgi:AAA domain